MSHPDRHAPPDRTPIQIGEVWGNPMTGERVIRSKGYLMGITAIYFLVLQTVAAQRDVRVAKELVAAASAIVERNDEWLFEAEFHRIKALTLLAKGGAETINQAEAELLTALKIAQQQSARSLALRAATSLAHLWRDQGKSPQARELLAPVYGWFTEGFDTPDLMEAKAYSAIWWCEPSNGQTTS